MSVKATVTQQLTVLETITTDVPDVSSSGAAVRHDQFNVGPTSLNSGTTPPASAYSGQQYTGTQTLDCTNLVGTNGAVVNGNALKVQAVQINNPSTNSGPLTVAPGVSNGLQLFGNVTITIPKGGSVNFYLGGNGPTVGSTAKTITITPNAGGDTYDVGLLFG